MSLEREKMDSTFFSNELFFDNLKMKLITFNKVQSSTKILNKDIIEKNYKFFSSLSLKEREKNSTFKFRNISFFVVVLEEFGYTYIYNKMHIIFFRILETLHNSLFSQLISTLVQE